VSEEGGTVPGLCAGVLAREFGAAACALAETALGEASALSSDEDLSCDVPEEGV
jgi:hypothetical protein